MNSGYIDDGYTRDDGYVAAAPENKAGQRLWEAMEFSYRPASRTEIVRHDAEVRIALRDENTDPDAAVKAEKLACDFVAKRLTRWDLKDSRGIEVLRSAEACARLNFALFQSLYRIIRGNQLSDPRLPATESPLSDAAQQKN